MSERSSSAQVSSSLVVEGYRADITPQEVKVTATGRSYDQRDDRAYQIALLIVHGPNEARRVANLILDAADAQEAMSA